MLLPLLIYANSLPNAFHYDDIHSLVDNPHIRKLEDIPSFFTSVQTTSLRTDKGHYRPVLFSTYALSYALGEYDPRMFRLFNLVFHVLNGLLVFAVFRRLFGNTAAAFFGALLFAVHPLNTESINYISCRSNVLATTFYLASVWLFLGYSGSGTERRRTALYACSLGCFVLGLLTKEIVIALPAILMLLDMLILVPDAKPFAYKALFRRHAAYWMIAGLHLFLIFAVDLKPVYERRDVLSNLIIQTKAMVFYLRLLVFPRGLSISHGFDMEGVMSAAFWASLFVIGGILFLAWKLRGRWGLLSFAILWYFVTLLPTSSILPLTIPVNEHRTYLPAVGFVVTVAFLLGLITTKSEEAHTRLQPAPASPRHIGASSGQAPTLGRRWQALSKFVVPFFAVVVGIFSVAVFARNQAWKTPITIWKDAVKKYPSNAHAYEALGVVYGNLGRWTESIEACKQAIRLRPGYAEAHLNLGFAYGKLGRYAEEVEAYKQAIRLKPDLAEAHYNLGSAYGNLGRWAEVIEACKQALRLRPGYAEAHLNLGFAYGKIDRYAEEVEAYKQATRLKPDLAEAHYNLGNAYVKLGRHAEAIEAFKQTVRLKPDLAEAYYNLGSAYGNLGRWAEMIEACKQALRLRPGYAEAHLNLGFAYGKLGRYAEEVEAYKQAIRLRPGYAEAHYNLGIAYSKLNRRDDALEEYKILKELDEERADKLFDLIY
ncbi:MAG: tetratricopeptide repeat protein [Acidobacteriota bacterium]|nr:MAG: tetratricopeptide repeat protein [Acidobacteriota bacterium]